MTALLRLIPGFGLRTAALRVSAFANARFQATGLAGVACVLGGLLGLALFVPAAQAQDVLPIPPASARVIDQTGTLGAARDELEAKLAAFEQASGPQIVILMVPTTQPEDIASYAYRVADSWKIGRREVGDGVLVVVAKDDHKVRIEVAKALEGAIPDLAARQIIDRAIKPAFRSGDYAAGLSSGVDMLEARIKGEHLPVPAASSQAQGQGAHAGRSAGSSWGHLAILFFFGIFVAGTVLKAFLGRTLGTLATGAGAGAVAWMSGAGLLMAGVAGVFALVVAGAMGLGSGASSLVGRRSGRGGGVGGMLLGGLLGSGLGGGFGGGRGGGGFGGGGGGGGFSSGGGGDFGGGGASGDW